MFLIKKKKGQTEVMLYIELAKLDKNESVFCVSSRSFDAVNVIQLPIVLWNAKRKTGRNIPSSNNI